MRTSLLSAAGGPAGHVGGNDDQRPETTTPRTLGVIIEGLVATCTRLLPLSSRGRFTRLERPVESGAERLEFGIAHCPASQ